MLIIISPFPIETPFELEEKLDFSVLKKDLVIFLEIKRKNFILNIYDLISSKLKAKTIS